MLRAASYGERRDILEFGLIILVCLCTLGTSFFSRATWALWEQNASETLCRIGVNYWRRALQNWRSRKAPALIHKKLRFEAHVRAAGDATS